MVGRTNLDGSVPTVVKSDLDSPNGVVYNGQDLYVIDAQSKAKQHNEAAMAGLYRYNQEGEWQELSGLSLQVGMKIELILPSRGGH